VDGNVAQASARGVVGRSATTTRYATATATTTQQHLLRNARRRTSTRTRGAAAAADAAASASNDGVDLDRYLHPPEVYYSEPGEEVLMQFGEGMRIEELPAGTRVAYPGWGAVQVECS
jgi:hypothetical protein